MKDIITLIMFWSVIQLLIVVFLLFIYFFTKLIIDKRLKNRLQKIRKISQLFRAILQKGRPLDDNIIQFFNKYIIEFLIYFELASTKKKYQHYANWTKIETTLAHHVLKPQARLLAYKNNWYKKYLATQCYELGKDIADEEVLAHLLNDNTILVSLNAALVIFKNPTTNTLNKVIERFSKLMRLKQVVFAHALTQQPLKDQDFIIEVLLKRLNTESNIDVQLFCYQLLILLKPKHPIQDFVLRDLTSDHIDLKLMILEYLFQIDNIGSKEILLSYLNDANDAIRTKVVKLLGRMEDITLLPYFIAKLGDPICSVRMHAAQALFKLGDQGIAVLKKQTEEENSYAFEAAQKFLKLQC